MWGGSAWRYNQPISEHYLISVLENLCVFNIAHCQTLWPPPTLSPPPLLLSNLLSLWHHPSSYCLIQHIPQHVFTCNKQNNKMWPLSHIHSSIQVSKGYKTVCYETHIGYMICKLTKSQIFSRFEASFPAWLPPSKYEKLWKSTQSPISSKTADKIPPMLWKHPQTLALSWKDHSQADVDNKAGFAAKPTSPMDGQHLI